MKTILSVVGARPNFMKIAPLIRAFRCHPSFRHILIHTGQHYDHALSGSFFDELDIPPPDRDLGVGSGTQAEQVGRTLIALEPVLTEFQPNLVLVVGDVNATVAAALAARKGGFPLAHVEAGLRSGDETMPEEINRIVTDRLATLLYTTEVDADAHLIAEGVSIDRIRRVGNVMIDTLDQQWPAVRALDLVAALAPLLEEGQSLPPLGAGFYLVTLHRPSNVDDPTVLRGILAFLREEVAAQHPVLWPMHPRTVRRLQESGDWAQVSHDSRLVRLKPLPYRVMVRLEADARAVITDSGGLQEECCVLGTPCLVLRTTTERPVTLSECGGVCRLAGKSPASYRTVWRELLSAPHHPYRPPLWDGHAAERIAQDLAARL